MKAILSGLKKRYEKTSQRSILIHTVSPPTIPQLILIHILHAFSPAQVNTFSQKLKYIQLNFHSTGVLVDDQRAKGMYATEKIYTDTDIDAIESLPLKAWHRAVDVEVVKADTEGSYF
jgi:hypothetical protein